MRKITQIHIHCSASDFGSVSLIREWHLKRGFRDIGYHFVILNGWVKKDLFINSLVGNIEVGRDLKEIPASIKGHNTGAVAICLIGNKNKKFHMKQFNSLISLLEELLKKYNLGVDKIYGHREITNDRLCPCFEVGNIREILNRRKELSIRP